MNSGAIISEDGKYHYQLWRIWDNTKPLVLWIMLNPSTADADIDDPTIRRCIGFTRMWGYGGLYVGNLFAYRATNPKKLHSVYNPMGNPKNRIHLRFMREKTEKIICAWGSFKGKNIPYYYEVFRKYADNYCLGTTKNGNPKHPLYLKSDSKLIEYKI
jgi:hypothetical protein